MTCWGFCGGRRAAGCALCSNAPSACNQLKRVGCLTHLHDTAGISQMSFSTHHVGKTATAATPPPRGFSFPCKVRAGGSIASPPLEVSPSQSLNKLPYRRTDIRAAGMLGECSLLSRFCIPALILSPRLLVPDSWFSFLVSASHAP